LPIFQHDGVKKRTAVSLPQTTWRKVEAKARGGQGKSTLLLSRIHQEGCRQGHRRASHYGK
ncbi:hypothetical protein, partial [Salmonella enterica]|uniref:hypothetical protein n=1 Tax=Salmonella enterica TaxID=28901 RepID=UPI001C4E0662